MYPLRHFRGGEINSKGPLTPSRRETSRLDAPESRDLCLSGGGKIASGSNRPGKVVQVS